MSSLTPCSYPQNYNDGSQIALIVYPFSQNGDEIISISMDLPCTMNIQDCSLTKHLKTTAENIYSFFKEVFGYSGLSGDENEKVHLKLFRQDYTKTFTCREGSCTSRAETVLGVEFIAHAYFHGIMKYGKIATCYRGEAGALSEALAYTFANIFKNWLLTRSSASNPIDWSITSKFNMSKSIELIYWDEKGKPGLKIKKEGSTENKAFITHYSRYPCHVYHLAVTYSGEKPWGKVAKVWFEALKNLVENETFLSFSKKTLSLSSDGATQSAIKKAWNKVLLSYESVSKENKALRNLLHRLRGESESCSGSISEEEDEKKE